jgi:hypothetical protein
LFIVLTVGLGVGVWLYRDNLFPAAMEPIVLQEQPVADEPPPQTGPQYPLSKVNEAEAVPRKLVTLPPLDDSDSYFLMALIDLFGTDVEGVLVKESLIDKFVGTVDGLPRGRVPERIRPTGRLSGTFVVDAAEDNEQFYLSSDNYQRYDPLVRLLGRARVDRIVEIYRRFYPLLQESYRRLGYPDGYFNDRVVEVIDLLLATPEPIEPLILVRPHVLYEFQDPELEALASGQKLLLRMGKDHAASVKLVLREFRAGITQTSAE